MCGWTRKLLPALCALVSAPAIAQDEAPNVSDKLDAGLPAAGRQGTDMYPVFVRMKDQLLHGAGDYEAFCRQHETAKRRQLRKQVIATLRKKSDKSWKAVSKRTNELANAGELRWVTRYWIVNGFACAASATGIHALAALDEVEFIYLKRGPRQVRLFDGPVRRRRRRGMARQGNKKQAAQALLDALQKPEPPFDPEGLKIPWNVSRVQADQVWRKHEVHGEGIVIAFLDTGLLQTSALTRGLWHNPGEKLDGKDDDHNGYVDDVFGYDFASDNWFTLGDPGMITHGSMCAGIAAGRAAGEPKTVTGIAPRARIMPIRGMGSIKAYEYALANGADVLSMSYMWVNVELGNYRGLYRLAHEHLAAAGVVSVGGAGNFAQRAPRGKQICLPKDIPCVIAAAGIDKNGEKARASSEGPCTWAGVKFYDDYPPDHPLMKPDVTGCFTGYPVWSRTNLRIRRWRVVWQGENNTGLVVGPGGNSFSGPHAAGVAALVMSANPDLPAWEVKSIIERTCKDLGEKGRDTIFGAGLLQALPAVEAALKRAGE